MRTYRELAKVISEMTEEQKDQDIVIYVSGVDEYYDLTDSEYGTIDVAFDEENNLGRATLSDNTLNGAPLQDGQYYLCI
jgi:hypothetical protein